jgi:elongator complex protein 3
MDSLEKRVAYAKSILKDIREGAISTPKELNLKQFYWCKKHSLNEVPTRPFILKQAKKPSKKVLDLLSIKPTRSLSGVQVIAVMMPPFDCPGKCTYCPTSFSDKTAPKSYTGFEPSAMRGQRLNFDPFEIVSNRIEQLDATGNKAEKIELIFQGSSFTVLKKNEQEKIVKKALEGIIGKKTTSFSNAKKIAEKSKRRVVGVTFETRPDYCSEKDIQQMLQLGGTRVEIGVQNPDNEIYKKIRRGHSVEDVINSTARLKDSSFKVLYHLMPGLPGSNYRRDLKNFKKVFSDSDFKPDMVKFYPCLVIRGTKLYRDWKNSSFNPLNEKRAIRLLADVKESIPKWVRIMRVNRDIPSTVISAGIMKTNLRQMVKKELDERKEKCNCIRCREIGLNDRKKEDKEKPKLKTIFYEASQGEEAFLSFETKKHLYAFLRLRNPAKPFMKQITNETALVRELHVYGKSLPLGKKSSRSEQHKGYGKLLMEEAEKIAKERFDANKMIVISGIGVREYYKKNFGYKIEEPFVSKKL